MRWLLLVALAIPACAMPKLKWFAARNAHEFRVGGVRGAGVVSSQGWRTDDGVDVRLEGARVRVGAMLRPARLTQFGLQKRSVAIGQELLFRGVYEGIDLRYHFREGVLEFDFEVRPGASADAIFFRTVGKAVRMEEGDLVWSGVNGEVRQHRPVAWTEDAAGRKTPVTAQYVAAGSSWRVQLGAYDKRRRLVIDPSITFGTYVGGPNDDRLLGSITDRRGNLYVLVDTQTTSILPAGDRPTQLPPESQIFGPYVAAKFSPDGALVYAVTLPRGGSLTSNPRMAADMRGNLYFVLGSPNIGSTVAIRPTSNLARQNLFTQYMLYKLNAWGNDLLITCVLPENPGAMAVDDSGNIYFSTSTFSQFTPTPGAFRTTAPTNQAPQRIVKVNPSATKVLAATYVENTGDVVGQMAVDAQGNVVVAGNASGAESRQEGAFQVANEDFSAFRSSDGGKTFRPVELRSASGGLMLNPVRDATEASRLWAHDSRMVLHRSEDFGATWEEVGPLPGTATSYSFRTFLAVYGVLGAVTTQMTYLSTDHGVTWTPLTFGTDLLVNPANRDILVCAFNTLLRSRDGGKTFANVQFSGPSLFFTNWRPFSYRRAMASFNNTQLFAWGFDDAQPIPLGPYTGPQNSITVPDPFDPLGGYMLRQAGLGVELVRLAPGIENRGTIPGAPAFGNALAADSGRQGVFYVFTSTDLLRTMDGGRTWASLKPDIPTGTGTLIVEGAPNEGVLLIKTTGSDLFFTRFTADLSQRTGSTTFGANGDETLGGIAFTPEGNVVLAGTTSSTNWSTRVRGTADKKGVRDAFVAVFTPDGRELRGFRMFGGSETEFASGVFVHSDGTIVLSGGSTSLDLETTGNALARIRQTSAPALPPGFVAVMDASLQPLFVSAYPGNGPDLLGIAGWSGDGRLWVTGTAQSTNLPAPGSTVSARPIGFNDIYLGVLDWR
ncbi:MAG: hypothetical protein U0R19_15705 [Bryobacteraceae bacterium]